MDSPSRHSLKSAHHEQEYFPPSRFTALRRATQARPREYARTRNHLDGAVWQPTILPGKGWRAPSATSFKTQCLLRPELCPAV
jgi:hypothetical protein